MNRLQYRHEYKHAINYYDYYALRQRVKLAARLDPNAGADGRYHIRSLYFDNDDDKVLKEKLHGLPSRDKFRIRLYNGNRDFIRLEKKSKRNGLCLKRSTMLTAEQAGRILRGDTGWMLSSQEPIVVELYTRMSYEMLRPRTIVDYWREAYIYPYGDVRVTFDMDVRTGLYSKGVLERDIPTLPTGEPGVLLLEIKYDEFLPDLMRDLIQTNTRRAAAFSKYAACRVYG